MDARDYTYASGVREWRDEQGRLHHDDGPAVIAPGLDLYYDHGKPLTATQHEALRRALAFRAQPTRRTRLSRFAK